MTLASSAAQVFHHDLLNLIGDVTLIGTILSLLGAFGGRSGWLLVDPGR